MQVAGHGMSFREWKDSVSHILHLLCIPGRNWGTKKYRGRKNTLFPVPARRPAKGQWLNGSITTTWPRSLPLPFGAANSKAVHFPGVLWAVRGKVFQDNSCLAMISASSHFQFHLSPETFLCYQFLGTGPNVPEPAQSYGLQRSVVQVAAEDFM